LVSPFFLFWFKLTHDGTQGVDACSLAFNKVASKRRFWMVVDGEIIGHEPAKLSEQPSVRQKMIDAGSARKV
jgi:hypothetical protein